MTSTTLYQPSPAEIAAAAESMTATYAGDAGRIERAKQLIADGAVSYVSNGIGWSVDSQRDSRKQDPQDVEPKNYLVSSVSCSCADHMFRAAAIGRCGDQQVVVNAACKHIYAVQILLRAISHKLHAALSQPMGPVYAVEMRHNLYGVYDRLTDKAICGAVYVVKTDSYRPETGQDAADFARWLAAQPVEAALPGGLLEKVLRNAPAKLTLRADVMYGSPRIYTLSGYRYDGGTWVNLEYEDRQQFNETAWANLLAATGFVMPGRPVKQRGLSYHYLLERGTAETAGEHYGLKAGAVEYVERAAVRRMLEQEGEE